MNRHKFLKRSFNTAIIGGLLLGSLPVVGCRSLPRGEGGGGITKEISAPQAVPDELIRALQERHPGSFELLFPSDTGSGMRVVVECRGLAQGWWASVERGEVRGRPIRSVSLKADQVRGLLTLLEEMPWQEGPPGDTSRCEELVAILRVGLRAWKRRDCRGESRWSVWAARFAHAVDFMVLSRSP